MKKIMALACVALLLVLFSGMTMPPSYAEEYAYILQWGSYGSDDGQFYNPHGVAVDGSGNVYVVDVWNYRVQKFTSSGSFILKWGSYGSDDGQFNGAEDVAVDGSGNVYVTDFGNDRVQKFTSSGTFITKWGSYGSGDGQFNGPCGVAVDASGNVYVADLDNHRVQKFTSSGSFILKWGSYGSDDGQFYNPYDVAVDASGNVYVTDTFNYRVQKFTSLGSFILKWGSYGSGDGQFYGPYNVAVDGSGNVYVNDNGNWRIQKFTSSGSFITKWGSYGSGDGQFEDPVGVAVDNSGNVYVADAYGNRVQKFVNYAGLVVRGSDNGIYYRTYNPVSGSWENWNAITGGTSDSPAVAEYDGKLHIVVRGTDANTLWYGWIRLSDNIFSGWMWLDGSTPSAPTLTTNGTVLSLVVRGSNNCLYYRYYSGGSWGSWYVVPTGATSGSPAAAMLGDNLHIVVQSMDGNSLWHIIVHEGTVVRDWTWISGSTPSKPALASSRGVNKLYLVVRGLEDTVYYRVYTALTDSWGSWTALVPGDTIDGPSATVTNNKLQVAVRGSTQNTLWYGTVDETTGSFSGWSWISGSTTSAPTLTS